MQFNGRHETEHYVFHYRLNTAAARDVLHIAQVQEACFARITAALGVDFPGRITYFLCDTPQEVGEFYGDNDPCNGFARAPDQVYAVYNESVRCIGPHEDAHLISYQIARPDCPFLREGLAMYFDGVWWSLPNAAWCRYYADKGNLPSLCGLLDQAFFFDQGCELTYPIAGHFVQWFYDRWGQETFLTLYRQSGDFADHMARLTGLPFEDLQAAFAEDCRRQSLTEAQAAQMDRELAR